MFALFFSFICAWFAFFLPCFATYKVLSQRPVSEPELERLSMYWSVVGAFVAVEYLAEWFVSWLPFYWEIKTVFLLFISLPQTQGSTFIYTTYLQPFFHKNEKNIDDGIVSMQASVISFIQTRLTMLWELLWSVINKTPTAGQPPSASGATQQNAPSLTGLWQTFGPGIISSLQPKAAPPANPASSAPPLVSTASSTSVSSVGTMEGQMNHVNPPVVEPVHS